MEEEPEESLDSRGISGKKSCAIPNGTSLFCILFRLGQSGQACRTPLGHKWPIHHQQGGI